MLVLPYLLGFSYYFLQIEDRIAGGLFPHSALIVMSLQFLLWIHIYHNRNEHSPYHLFFGSFLGMIFSMQSIIKSEEAFSHFIQKSLFYADFLDPNRFETSKLFQSSLYFADILDKFPFYAVAGIIIILSFFFITDLYRDCKERSPNKVSTLVLMGPPMIYSFWYPQNGGILLLPFFSLALGASHYLWRSILGSLLATLHPSGWMFLTQQLTETTKVKLGVSIITFIPLPAMFFIIAKEYQYYEFEWIYILPLLLGSLCFSIFSYFSLSYQNKISFRQKFGNQVFFVLLISFYFFPGEAIMGFFLLILLSFPSLKIDYPFIGYAGVFLSFVLSQNSDFAENYSSEIQLLAIGLAIILSLMFYLQNQPKKSYQNKSSIAQ